MEMINIVVVEISNIEYEISNNDVCSHWRQVSEVTSQVVTRDLPGIDAETAPPLLASASPLKRSPRVQTSG
jgi:hypothetical protein